MSFASSLRRSFLAAAGIASLLGPVTASAGCIDFDGDRKCVKHKDVSDVPPVAVTPSTGTYQSQLTLPPREPKETPPPRKEPPPPSNESQKKFVRHE